MKKLPKLQKGDKVARASEISSNKKRKQSCGRRLEEVGTLTEWGKSGVFGFVCIYTEIDGLGKYPRVFD